MFTAKDTGKGQEWEPIPNGVYHAVCYAVVDLGTQYSQMFGISQHKCWISWEFPQERIVVKNEDNEDINKPRIISEFFTVSLHEKSNLRQILESWRGRGFTQSELNGFDLSSILGVNCQINVIHKTKQDGSKRAVIGSIMPLSKGMKKFDPENDLIYFSFEEHGREITGNVPDGIKAMIMRSKEWNETGQQQDEWVENNLPPELQGPDDPWQVPPSPEDDDEIPF